MLFGATSEEWALIVALPLNQVSSSALNTVVGPFRAYFGFSYSELGLILASYGLARLVSNLPAAVLVRRLNVRSLLLGSLVINGLTAGLSIGASAPWQLLASRIIQGGCSAIVQASILVWLLVKASPSSRGQVMALSEALYAVVGLLASVLGWGAAFVAATAGAFGAFVAILTATTADDVPHVSDVPGDQARNLRG
jgi:MFS transporter, DHA1 family, multidrug resistance protein